MKKIILFMLSIGCAVSVFAQNYYPQGTQWIYSKVNSSNNPLHDFVRYTVIKDTIVDNLSGVVIESGGEKYTFLQDDSEIFYQFKGSLLKIYDFSITLGDTVEFQFPAQSEQTFEIDTFYTVNCVLEQLDSVESENGLYLKKYHTRIIPTPNIEYLSNIDTYVFTESIGDEDMFIHQLKLPSIGLTTPLRCFSWGEDKYISSFWKSQNKNCNYNLSVGLESNLRFHEIYYDNQNDKLNILGYIDTKIIIYDTNGKIITEKNIDSNTYNIDMGNINGVFLYHIIDDSTIVQNGKILVQ